MDLVNVLNPFASLIRLSIITNLRREEGDRAGEGERETEQGGERIQRYLRGKKGEMQGGKQVEERKREIKRK